MDNFIEGLLLICIVIFLVFCVSKCIKVDSNSPQTEIVQEEQTQDENQIDNLPNDDVYIWTDSETGVQYVIYSHGNGYRGMGGITPRLKADGSLYIVKECE